MRSSCRTWNVPGQRAPVAGYWPPPPPLGVATAAIRKPIPVPPENVAVAGVERPRRGQAPVPVLEELAEAVGGLRAAQPRGVGDRERVAAGRHRQGADPVVVQHAERGRAGEPARRSAPAAGAADDAAAPIASRPAASHPQPHAVTSTARGARQRLRLRDDEVLRDEREREEQEHVAGVLGREPAGDRGDRARARPSCRSARPRARSWCGCPGSSSGRRRRPDRDPDAAPDAEREAEREAERDVGERRGVGGDVAGADADAGRPRAKITGSLISPSPVISWACICRQIDHGSRTSRTRSRVMGGLRSRLVGTMGRSLLRPPGPRPQYRATALP